MIGGIILAVIGVAVILLGPMLIKMIPGAEALPGVAKYSKVLGLLLLIAGVAWVGLAIYRRGAKTQQAVLGAQTAYQIAQNEGNPAVIAANQQAYNDCYNNCWNNMSSIQRTLYRRRNQALCHDRCN